MSSAQTLALPSSRDARLPMPESTGLKIALRANGTHLAHARLRDNPIGTALEQPSTLLTMVGRSPILSRMEQTKACGLGISALLLTFSLGAQIPVLKRSDVIFMYQAPKETYEAYGASVLAWGGTPNSNSLAEAQGLRFFGSVGMVTEFSRYHQRFPDTYEQGLCRDLKGQPYKVPWLTDHNSKGVPYWWCCTRQPLFRQYISERVIATVKAGAHGVHIDDHLGTAGSLWLGGCFCERCTAEFRDELKANPAAEVADPAGFDYPAVLRAWLAAGEGRKIEQHPLWPRWRAYQLRGAARFMAELRALAAKTAGHPVPMSANACLLWGPHLNDHPSLDFFSAEIDHHAASKKISDAPIVAYRIAEAVGRPLASTASGGDWAFVKEHNQHGLVQSWVALGYAAGHSLMAPHRQWCYTQEKGTHWYAGPREKFAPLYKFVSENRRLFDGYETFADVAVVYAQRTYDRDSGKLMKLCSALTSANISYSLMLGGDDVVVHSLDPDGLRQHSKVLVLEENDLKPEDKRALGRIPADRRLSGLDEALKSIKPATAVRDSKPVRVLPRIARGSAVLHLVNWAYDLDTDSVVPQKDVRVEIDAAALGVPGATRAELHAPGSPMRILQVKDGGVVVPELGVWALLRIN